MPKMRHPLIPVLLLIIVAMSIGAAKKGIDYNFNAPNLAYFLPDTLREISGLTLIDHETFACIQDENGIVFIYDLTKNEIRHQFDFHSNGDYEDIALVNKTIYVLRSDGTLYEIVDYTSPTSAINEFATGIPALNNEGLCHDKKNNRLLIACKGKAAKGPEFKNKRFVFSFDLATKTLSKNPVFTFDNEKIKEYALQNNVPLAKKQKKNGLSEEVMLKFKTSAIGIHPKTKQLYLLSASDYLLFIFTPDGDILHIEKLNPVLFNKAEGITFFENGDLLITNEAQEKRPTLLRFNYRK